MNKIVHETIVDVMLFALPADILYLFFVGSWIEPNPLIFWTEMVILFGLPGYALYRVSHQLADLLVARYFKEVKHVQ